VEDLAAWLTAVWDEEEEIALTAAGWDHSGRKRANGQWVRSGIGSVEDAERRSVIYSDNDQVTGSVADHVAYHDPASVLARIAADRKILAMHAGNHECPSAEDNCGWWTPGEANFVGESEVLTPGPYCPTILLLASPQADKPGFRPEWLVERQGVER